MRSYTTCLAGIAALLMSFPAFAQAQADSVVLRITSPRGAEVQFSGVVALKDSKTERRIENARTPFELRLAAQDIDARFSARDGGSLSGDIVTYSQGTQRGRVTGTMYIGEVKLYFQPGGAFGFGSRLAQGHIP
jgi:hypothetical protein